MHTSAVEVDIDLVSVSLLDEPVADPLADVDTVAAEAVLLVHASVSYVAV